jgi:hypothetical protein
LRCWQELFHTEVRLTQRRNVFQLLLLLVLLLLIIMRELLLLLLLQRTTITSLLPKCFCLILLRFADDGYSDTYISTIGVDFKIRTIDVPVDKYVDVAASLEKNGIQTHKHNGKRVVTVKVTPPPPPILPLPFSPKPLNPFRVTGSTVGHCRTRALSHHHRVVLQVLRCAASN